MAGALLLVTGCGPHLGSTGPDLWHLGGVGQFIVLAYWTLAGAGLLCAMFGFKSVTGKVVAMVLVAAAASYVPFMMWRAVPDPSARRAEVAKAGTGFLEACDKDAGETAPSRPFRVNHLYVYDATPNVRGSYDFTIFDDYKSAIAVTKKLNAVTVVDHPSDAVVAPGNFLLQRTVIAGSSQEAPDYRGVRQDLIDTVSGEVKATRTNFYLGNDFARGVSCLDSNWSRGFADFIIASIGFDPGNSRSDAWIRAIPRQFARGEVVARRAAAASAFTGPIQPAGAVYDYNHRKIVLDGIPHALRGTFNGEPLRMVGVQSYPERMLIAYETHRWAPSVVFQIRHKRLGTLLQEIYVKLPLELHRSKDGGLAPHLWRIASEGVSFEDGKVMFDIVQTEGDAKPDHGPYVRYTIEAPWKTEDIAGTGLSDRLDDGNYGRFALPEGHAALRVSERQIVGSWISVPSGTPWIFVESNKNLLFDEYQSWEWTIDNGVLTAHAIRFDSVIANAAFRLSRDGKALEVRLQDEHGTYEPFLLKRAFPPAAPRAIPDPVPPRKIPAPNGWSVDAVKNSLSKLPPGPYASSPAR